MPTLKIVLFYSSIELLFKTAPSRERHKHPGSGTLLATETPGYFDPASRVSICHCLQR